MFGFISKKKLLKKMDELLESGRQKNNGAKYPPETEKDECWNLITRGYEDGHFNFYNALHSEFFE
jgi:hypothetical protein